MLTKRNTTIFLTIAALIMALALTAARLPDADQGGRPLTASLSGAAEVPGPGNEDGGGAAYLTLNPGQEMVCWQIMVSDITLPASGAHIHEGDSSVAGSVVVALSAPDESGMSSGCTAVDRELIKEIMHNPDGFYVNVHNADYPDGALRGQLEK